MAVNVAAGNPISTLGRHDRDGASATGDARGCPADVDALRRIAKGDDEAVRDVFSRHWNLVARAAFRITGDEDEARDAAQEAFIRLYRRPPQPETSLRAWLCRVATNVAVNDLRSGRRRACREARQVDVATSAEPTDGIAAANLRAEQALVREVLHALPVRSRELLLLRAEGFRYHEIASAIGVAPGSIGTLLTRAELAFRASYEARRGGA
jgi:RNA polymerase sigma-70 factor (ECF subfamily)